jgi:O-antigen ligase
MVELFGSFVLAAGGSFALSINVTFTEVFPFSHLAVVLVLLVLVHLLRHPRFVFNREYIAYALFVAYMFVQLSWTRDIQLAMNTLTPAVTFIVILVLFGSLVRYHNRCAVLSGMLGGVLTCAGIYTVTVGFPLVRPFEFSYNAIAGMYLFGLFISLLLVSHKYGRGLALFVGLIFLLLVVATTSIKTNLGILLGAAGAGLIYFKQLARVARKNAVPLAALAGLLAYLVVSSNTLMQTIASGYDRVILGIEILEARENMTGYSGLDNRSRWALDGLTGWMQNPIFGHGVEAFRSRYGITSHSSAVDLLYNSGLIGFSLFYYIFLSMIWRLITLRNERTKPVGAVILGMIICYMFITLSGAMHYNSFLAAFVAIGSVLLSQQRRQRFYEATPARAAY